VERSKDNNNKLMGETLTLAVGVHVDVWKPYPLETLPLEVGIEEGGGLENYWEWWLHNLACQKFATINQTDHSNPDVVILLFICSPEVKNWVNLVESNLKILLN
jgi:hypothetical protein